VNLYVLNDGTEVVIRPIRADDGEKLKAAHARLSPESRYRRFLGAKPQLTEAEARYLVEIDGSDHHALVATLVGELDGELEPIVAVARYIRLPADPQAAEFAIVVADSLQRQGLAAELLDRLAQAAAVRGVRRFRATTLADNVSVLRLMQGIATQPPEVRSYGPISEIDVELAA
jgi:RimJ/RimL family protein N-acetyltransferase